MFAHSPYLNNVGLSSEASDDNRKPNKGNQASHQHIANLIAQGKVVGICQGWGECGPRALGNRSILALPTEDIRDRISLKMKEREWYRPLAPIMLLENAKKVTGRESMPPTSKYMLSQFQILPEFRNYIPGVIHSDGTSRVQVVCVVPMKIFLNNQINLIPFAQRKRRQLYVCRLPLAACYEYTTANLRNLLFGLGSV